MISDAIDSMKHKGSFYLHDISALYAQHELDLVNDVVFDAGLPWEHVLIGDADEPNNVDVARFIIDVEQPQVVNDDYTNALFPVVCNPRVMAFFRQLAGNDDIYIRRMQVNKLHKNSFIGKHIDCDSNPDYLFSVVLQLGEGFSGGEFVVYSPEEKLVNEIVPARYSVAINDCRYPHEVKTVTDGVRVSLVYFISKYPHENRRVRN